jgi:hypothetical protein
MQRRSIVLGTRAQRMLVGSLSLVLGLTFLVVPATAGQRTTTTTITDNPGGCSFTVTYTWSGFSGGGLVADVALGYEEAGGLDVVFAGADFPDQVGSSGSASATFTLTGAATVPHRYFGRGALLAKAKKNSPYNLSSVRRSVEYSDFLDPRACGSTVTVS